MNKIFHLHNSLIQQIQKHMLILKNSFKKHPIQFVMYVQQKTHKLMKVLTTIQKSLLINCMLSENLMR